MLKKILGWGILSLSLVLTAGCSNEEPAAPADNNSAVNTYIIRAATTNMSRVAYVDEDNTMNCYWEIGDIVTIANANGFYDFVVESLNANGTANLSYDGDIADAANFTGTATYYGGTAPGGMPVQTADGSTTHLKYGEVMVAPINNVDLTKMPVLVFTHQNAIYRANVKAAAAYPAGSIFSMSGAWNGVTTNVRLNWDIAEGDVFSVFLNAPAGDAPAGTKLNFVVTTPENADGDLETYIYTGVPTADMSYTAGRYWIANFTSATPDAVKAINSGVKNAEGKTIYWAEKNVGAATATDDGLYFCWGEVVGHDDTYITSDSYELMGKNPDELKAEGWVDDNYNLLPIHDAAHVNWGGLWRMATEAEMLTLGTSPSDINFDTELGPLSPVGVKYLTLKDKSTGKTVLILPAPGYIQTNGLYYHYSSSSQPRGVYWNATANTEVSGSEWAKEASKNASRLWLVLRTTYIGGFGTFAAQARNVGGSIRPVIVR